MFLALRDLRRTWRRFLLVGLVVGLVAMLSTVLAGLARGLVSDGISGLRGLPLTHLAFAPHADAVFSRSTLDGDALRAWAAVEDTAATPIGLTFVNATSPDGGPSIDLALLGVDPDGFLAPGGDLDRGIVVAEELREDGVEIGDRFTIGGTGEEVEIAGFTPAGSYGHVPFGFAALDRWRAIAYGDDHRERFSAVALRAGDGADLAAADREAGTETVTKVAAYDGSPGYKAETSTMTLIRAFLLVISALIVGAFFTVLVVQRTRQIGLLKALGAPTRYIARDALGQIAIVVVAATVAGSVAGAAIVAALDGGPVPVELSIGGVAGTAGILIVTAIAGSLVAVRRIAGVEPVIALGVEP